MTRAIVDCREAIEGERFYFRGRERVVMAKAHGRAGMWICISCGEALPSFPRDKSHCDQPRQGADDAPGGRKAPLGKRARHVLAWYSAETDNYEVP